MVNRYLIIWYVIWIKFSFMLFCFRKDSSFYADIIPQIPVLCQGIGFPTEAVLC